jgi:predicted CXXCH cytochrome family protein
MDPAGDALALSSFTQAAGNKPDHVPQFVLGHKPLWQPLLSGERGRWQAHELAYDPMKQEWFNVFGHEQRQAGEWGHWTGRGMNWNSMCAQCHMTGFEKKYDIANDSYRSTWIEHGVGCIQCHGSITENHGTKNFIPPNHQITAAERRHIAAQTCAPCHARNEQLTLTFQPGSKYSDHYRVVLPIEPGVFWPDGQQRDEDFNWTSVLLSRMGHAGVTCMDCHDPHTTRTILPVSNNQLCLQCHAVPGRIQPNGTRAVPIDPVAHSHHQVGSAGISCIGCHMPATTYMQRAPRHDHGWIKPDPLLTKELGIPNACSQCHSDRPIEWVIAQVDRWYGAKMDSHQRARARAVAAAQSKKPTGRDALLTLLHREDIAAWRATFLGLLTDYAADPNVAESAMKSLAAPDPLERSAAIRLLADSAVARESLTPLLSDPVRLVRLDAAWALSRELPLDSPARKELDTYLAITSDQPGGRLRMGQDFANRGMFAEAERELALAAAWDPLSPGIEEAYGMVLMANDRPAEAAARFQRASELAPRDAQIAYKAALAYAEAAQPVQAESWLRITLARDPQLDRAWYNLGLLVAQENRLTEAVESLTKAERIATENFEYSYALATILLRLGDRAGARAAAERAQAINPNHPGTRQILSLTDKD